MSTLENTRRVPRQNRSRVSVDCILEAAIQVLEADGEVGFNTNAVAERAGVSVGTLYRYFPDKRSVLTALAARETAAHQKTVTEILKNPEPGLARDRALIRAFVQAFAGRTQARRIAVTALLAQADHRDLAVNFATGAANLTNAHGHALTRVQTFVLLRSVHGAMRAAVLEGADFLLSREFEDELVRLGRAYLGYAPPASA